MEKFLWNLAGVVLFAINVFCLMVCIASQDKAWAISLIVLAAVDWLYKTKRPTWVEV